MLIHNQQQEDFCSSRLCALASLRSHSPFNAKSQSRRDAKSIVNPCLNVFRVVAHPTDHYKKPRDFTRLTQEDGSLSRGNLCNLVVILSDRHKLRFLLTDQKTMPPKNKGMNFTHTE